MRIQLYQGYAADQRISMQIYADRLARCLSSLGLRVNQFAPKSKLESQSNWLMRYLRYFEYPRQVGQQAADIHHVIDHGYAHLINQFSDGIKCVTVHDLIPLLAHLGKIQGTEKKRNPWLNRYSLSFIKQFDYVIAPSESTASDLQTYLGVQRDQVSVIPPVIDSCFALQSEAAVDEFAQRYDLPQEHQWLLITGQEFYKNHITSLKVLKKLRDQGHKIKLLKTGVVSRQFAQQAHQLGLTDHVRQVYLADAKDLPLAYGFADCLLFPSLYEGFGMPVLEALACGTSVVTSNAGALAQTGGQQVQRSAPLDSDGLAILVANVIDSLPDKASVVEQTKAYLAQYRPAAIGPLWGRLYG